VILSGIILTTYASDNGEENNKGYSGLFNKRMMAGTCGQIRERMLERIFGRSNFRFIEISEGFKEKVLNITQSDQDVQDLLNDGYNITGIRPIIKAFVEADGTVIKKATNAVVKLQQDTTGHAVVWVDIEEAKVTKIVILTRTVIEKP
jgi:hypothetical protein